MRVALISALFPPTRAPEADYAMHLARELARTAEVHVVTSRIPGIARPPGVKVHDAIGAWSWRDLPRILRLVRKIRPDAVVLSYVGWNYDHHPMVTFLPLFLPRTRFVTLLHNVHGASSSKATLRDRILRRLLKAWAGKRDTSYDHGTLISESDCVVILNEAHRRALGARDALLLPAMPLITTTAFPGRRADLGLTDADFVFAYFGYVYPTKGVDTLFRAFHEVTRRNPDARLLMIGGEIDGRGATDPRISQTLQDMLVALDIVDKVRFTGGYEWDSGLPSRALGAADACVLPFDHGAGTHNSSLAGALAHGLPIITTRGDATDEMLDGLLLCPPRDPLALAAAMERVMHDRALRNRLGWSAVTLARDVFCARKVAGRLLEAIELRG